MKIECVTIDCRDPAAVAWFWSAALGWNEPVIAPDSSGAIVGQSGGGMYLEFMRVPEAKTVKNRLHFGCHAGTLAELAKELSRLARLGATIAWEEEFPGERGTRYRNVIVRDVEGNEFCLSGGAWD
jgi:hypothetical protein